MQENKKMAIIVPPAAMPKKDPEHPCPCQDIPVKLLYKKGIIITWLKQTGESVEQNEVICEGEVEKKSIEFTAPCSGKLTEQCIGADEAFEAGSILGYIENGGTYECNN